MNTPENIIQVGIADEDKINQEFIDAWHRAERDEIREPEDRLYFTEPETFLKVLSNDRLDILHALRTHKIKSIRALSRILNRAYGNVYNDVQLLKKGGLIRQTSSENIFVPWDKICAEIDIRKRQWAE